MIKCRTRVRWPKRVKRESFRSMKISNDLKRLWTKRNSSSNAKSNKRKLWSKSSGKDCNKKKGRRKRQKYANTSNSWRKCSKKENSKPKSSNLFLENSNRQSHFTSLWKKRIKKNLFCPALNRAAESYSQCLTERNHLFKK